MSAAKPIKRMKNKAPHTVTAVGEAAASLRARFEVRRVILEGDRDRGVDLYAMQAAKSQKPPLPRSDADNEVIWKFVSSETRVARDWPLWAWLSSEEQRRLCGLMNYVSVPRRSPATAGASPEDAARTRAVPAAATTAAIDPTGTADSLASDEAQVPLPHILYIGSTEPSPALWLVLCGKATRVDAHAELAAAVNHQDGDGTFADTHATTFRGSDVVRNSKTSESRNRAAAALGASHDLPPGAVCGGDFLLESTHDANAANRREDFRRDWVAARAGATPAAPVLGREYGASLKAAKMGQEEPGSSAALEALTSHDSDDEDSGAPVGTTESTEATPIEEDGYKVTCWPGAEYLQLTCADALPIVAEAAARAGRSACLMPLGLKCAAPFSSTVEFRDQELLVHEGQSSATMYVIVEGECRLLLKPGKQKRKKKGMGAASTSSDADEASDKELATLGPNTFVGDISALLSDAAATTGTGTGATESPRGSVDDDNGSATSHGTSLSPDGRKKPQPLGTPEPASVMCIGAVRALAIPAGQLAKTLAVKPELLSALRANAQLKQDWLLNKRREVDALAKQQRRQAGRGGGGASLSSSQLSPVREGDDAVPVWGRDWKDSSALASLGLFLDGLLELDAFRGWSEPPGAAQGERDDDAGADGVDEGETNRHGNVDDDEGSLKGGGGSNASVESLGNSSSVHTAASEKRFKLVQQLLVRTFDGLDPAAKKALGGRAPPVWHGLSPEKRHALERARELIPPKPAAPSIPDSFIDDDNLDNFNEDDFEEDSVVSPPARTRVGLPKPQPPPPRPVDDGRHRGRGLFDAQVSADPLMPFPTLTRARGMHARTLPLVHRSDGFLNALAGTSDGHKMVQHSAMGPGAGRAVVAALRPERLEALPSSLKAKLRKSDLAHIDGAIARGVDALLRR